MLLLLKILDFWWFAHGPACCLAGGQPCRRPIVRTKSESNLRSSVRTEQTPELYWLKRIRVRACGICVNDTQPCNIFGNFSVEGTSFKEATHTVLACPLSADRWWVSLLCAFDWFGCCFWNSDGTHTHTRCCFYAVANSVNADLSLYQFAAREQLLLGGRGPVSSRYASSSCCER